jgi:hypothetical protein
MAAAITGFRLPEEDDSEVVEWCEVLKSEERDIFSGVLRWPECWLRLWTKVVVIVFRERNWRLEVREGKYLSQQKIFDLTFSFGDI